MVQSRIFYSLLQRVGLDGNYQMICMVYWSMIFYTTGAASFINPFLYYQNQYKCPSRPDINQNCHQYVCSLPNDQRSSFIDPNFKSMTTNFGDYRCQGSVELDNIQSFIYIGGIVGVVMGALFNSMITKVKFMILTHIINILCLIFTIFSPNLMSTGIGLFIHFAVKSIQLGLVPCLITEQVSSELAGRYIIIGYTWFSVGATLNGLIFLYISAWKWVIGIHLLLPALISLAGFIFYVQQSPFDLVINGNSEKAFLALQRIAMINGKQFNITVQQLVHIKQEYQISQQNKHNFVISFIDLFRFKSLRILTIASLCLRFLTYFQFTAPELALKDYSLDIYFNGIIIGSSQFFMNIINLLMIGNFERKKTVIYSSILAIMISIPILLIVPQKNENQQIGLKLLQTSGLFIFRFFSTATLNFFDVHQFQVFPVQIKGIAIQFTSSFCYLGMVVIPPLVTMLQNYHISVIYSFISASILICLFTLFLPQTLNVPSPEIIQELRYQHHQSSIQKDRIKQT